MKMMVTKMAGKEPELVLVFSLDTIEEAREWVQKGGGDEEVIDFLRYKDGEEEGMDEHAVLEAIAATSSSEPSVGGALEQLLNAVFEFGRRFEKEQQKAAREALRGEMM